MKQTNIKLGRRRAYAGRQQGVMHMYDRGLSEEQRMMRQSCRDFVDDVVLPFIRRIGSANGRWCRRTGCRRASWKRPTRSASALWACRRNSAASSSRRAPRCSTFALIAEEIARGDSGLADKMVQNWKVSVLLRRFAPQHLQEKWFPAWSQNRNS